MGAPAGHLAKSAMDIDKAVAAVINELERQSREDTLGLYGSIDDPHSFGIDGDVDLVALVRVAIEAAAAPKVRSNDLSNFDLMSMTTPND